MRAAQVYKCSSVGNVTFYLRAVPILMRTAVLALGFLHLENLNQAHLSPGGLGRGKDQEQDLQVKKQKE